MALPRLAGPPFAALHQGVETALEVVAVEMRFTAVVRQAKREA